MEAIANLVVAIAVGMILCMVFVVVEKIVEGIVAHMRDVWGEPAGGPDPFSVAKWKERGIEYAPRTEWLKEFDDCPCPTGDDHDFNPVPPCKGSAAYREHKAYLKAKTCGPGCGCVSGGCEEPGCENGWNHNGPHGKWCREHYKTRGFETTERLTRSKDAYGYVTELSNGDVFVHDLSPEPENFDAHCGVPGKVVPKEEWRIRFEQMFGPDEDE